ncbi:MAG: hypothetical protein IT429_16555 [Gemmataceae bacterium]|nr:hypothetical protein [Gemmataceae bacterium]
MRAYLQKLMQQLWNDDCGAILSSEYMMLGTIAVLGGASGLSTLRDAANDELRGMGDSIRQVRQTYAPGQFRNPAPQQVSPAATTQGHCGNLCP